MDPSEAVMRRAVLSATAAEPDRVQLVERDDAVLPRGQGRERLVPFILAP